MVRFNGGCVGLWVGGLAGDGVVGSVVQNQWWEDRLVNGFQRMGRWWVGW